MGCGEHLRYAEPESGATSEVKRLFGLELLNRGLFTPADAFIWAISAPMTDAEIDRAVATLRETLVELRPLIEGAAPGLLVD
jgi:glutamate-1-semialdehyde aminotransferase